MRRQRRENVAPAHRARRVVAQPFVDALLVEHAEAHRQPLHHVARLHLAKTHRAIRRAICLPGVPQLVRRDVRRRCRQGAAASAAAGAPQPADATDAAEERVAKRSPRDEGATGDAAEEGADTHPEDEEDGDHDGAGRAAGVISRQHVEDSPRAAQEERVEEGQHEHADAAVAPADAAVAPVHGCELA